MPLGAKQFVGKMSAKMEDIMLWFSGPQPAGGSSTSGNTC